MQPSTDKDIVRIPGYALAVTAEVLYVVNLLLLPGLAFLLLGFLYLTKRQTAPPLAASHLDQTISASLWAGVLLVLVNLLILLLGGYNGAWTWVILIIWFTSCHATLVMFGVIGLSKAMAARCWRYPLVGRPLPADCPGFGER
ncbi:MAG: hypothetical protein KDJ38_09140 [Gammaproteobacteria bacterium]|nr:hypothetical protein [Gammaproteobacteria bacterium]